MLLNADLIIGLVCSAITAVVFFATRDLSKLGGVFVNYMLVALGTLSLIVLVKGFVKPERIKFFQSAIERNNVLTGVTILAIYLAVMPFVGFLPSSFVFYTVFSLYLSEARLTTGSIVKTTVLSALVVLFFYLIFHKVLEVPLPVGVLFGGD